MCGATQGQRTTATTIVQPPGHLVAAESLTHSATCSRLVGSTKNVDRGFEHFALLRYEIY